MRKRITALFVAVIMLISACDDAQSVTAYSTEELMTVITESVEFPPIVSKDDISEFGVQESDVEEFSAIQQMLSVDVVEVVLIKTVSGRESDVLEALRSRKDELINTYAFYPGQKESAEATVVGSACGVCYLICHSEASDAETALLEMLNE